MGAVSTIPIRRFSGRLKRSTKSFGGVNPKSRRQCSIEGEGDSFSSRAVSPLPSLQGCNLDLRQYHRRAAAQDPCKKAKGTRTEVFPPEHSAARKPSRHGVTAEEEPGRGWQSGYPVRGCTRTIPPGIGTKEGGGSPKGASRATKPSKGSTPNERTSEGTGESGGEGHATKNANQKSSEQSWRLVTRGRFRANGYVCGTRPPFQNLIRNLFPPRRFSPPGDSAAFNGTA
jgi:hypothetical protein